ncbi:MAG: pyruvate synthase subunit beta [Deltaproteobacteria bacterium]|nr:pyruvate synthase subunit beta [Deltaproteobacteria bacterium]
MSNMTILNARNITNEELFFGHKACAGCGGSLAVRLAMKVIGRRSYVVVPANCMSAVGFMYPAMSFGVSGLCCPFASTAAVLSGITQAARQLGEEDYYVVGFAGDGGTADIGLQALSGAVDRNDRIIYICYDNEAYMNTGVQESGLSPYGTKTTTSPEGAKKHGANPIKKNMFEIVAAHNIGYAATASVGYPQDYINKVARAKAHPGASYIHVMAPCPTGWGAETDVTTQLAREAVDCGLWYLAEYENGEFRLNKNPKEFKPVKDYLTGQGRFRRMREQDFKIVEEQRDAMWAKIRKNWQTA